MSNVLPTQTLRHDGRTQFGWSHWPHQSYYTPPIPTSKENDIEGLLGRHALYACWGEQWNFNEYDIQQYTVEHSNKYMYDVQEYTQLTLIIAILGNIC